MPMPPQQAQSPSATNPGAALMNSGMMGPLAASMAMLNASGPSRTPQGLGQVFGQGLGGLMQGSQIDQQQGLLSQQQNALSQIANRLQQKQGGQPGGGAPGIGGQGGGAPGIMGVPSIMMQGGGMPQGGGAQQTALQNPFQQLMQRRRMGRTA